MQCIKRVFTHMFIKRAHTINRTVSGSYVPLHTCLSLRSGMCGQHISELFIQSMLVGAAAARCMQCVSSQDQLHTVCSYLLI